MLSRRQVLSKYPLIKGPYSVYSVYSCFEFMKCNVIVLPLLPCVVHIIMFISSLSFSNIFFAFCSSIDPVIIEEIRVFDRPVPIVNMQLAKQAGGEGKLIIITDDEVKSIDLHRCQRASSCRLVW